MNLASPIPSATEELWLRYLRAQLAGNRKEALRLVIEEGLRRGLSVQTLQTEVVQRAQREIGRLWQENRIGIAQEHMATAISQVVMSRLFEEAPLAPNLGKKVLIACVEGELHEFPARMVSDFLELAGFDVRYLGASVPTDSLIALVAAEKPDLLALSVTMSFNATSLRNAVERVRKEFGSELPILVGGHAVAWAPGLVSECGVETADLDAKALVAKVKRLLLPVPS